VGGQPSTRGPVATCRVEGVGFRKGGGWAPKHQGPEVHTLLDQVYLNQKQGIIHEQSGHSRFMEEGMYGLRTDESPFSTQGNQERFKKASKHWHRFLEFPLAVQGRATEQEREREGAAGRERKWEGFRRVNLSQKLREIKGEGAQFRGKQREALRAMIGVSAQVVVVMGTGSGKSILY
jgi:superfamily II DNA helicase RecQ